MSPVFTEKKNHLFPHMTTAERSGIPVEIAQRRVCTALTGYFGDELRFPVLREQRVDQ